MEPFERPKDADHALQWLQAIGVASFKAVASLTRLVYSEVNSRCRLALDVREARTALSIAARHIDVDRLHQRHVVSKKVHRLELSNKRPRTRERPRATMAEHVQGHSEAVFHASRSVWD